MTFYVSSLRDLLNICFNRSFLIVNKVRISRGVADWLIKANVCCGERGVDFEVDGLALLFLLGEPGAEMGEGD